MKTSISSPDMNELTITCPSCSAPIPLSEAVTRQIRERLTQDFEASRKVQEQALAEREHKLREQQTALNQAQNALDEQVRKKLEDEKAKLLAKARQEVHSQLAVEMQDIRNQLTERTQKLEQAQAAELKLRQQQRILEERQQTLELEVTRKLDEERRKIHEAAKRQAAEEQRLRLADKEKLIADLQKQIETLRQKAHQGSQQAQGEVLELELESLLKAQFPHDEMVPIGTGTRGADLLQKVRTAAGMECGILIWESKRTRNWSPGWLAKLKDDQRAHSADLAILLSQALPADIKTFGHLDGIWVTDLNSCLGLAAALRQGLIHVAQARQAEVGKKEKMESLYEYLSGREFRQRIEALVESFVAQKEDLEAEKRVLIKSWARREKQLTRALESTARLYGEVQEIVGQSALPEIKVFQLEPPSEGQIENQKTQSEY